MRGLFRSMPTGTDADIPAVRNMVVRPDMSQPPPPSAPLTRGLRRPLAIASVAGLLVALVAGVAVAWRFAPWLAAPAAGVHSQPQATGFVSAADFVSGDTGWVAGCGSSTRARGGCSSRRRLPPGQGRRTCSTTRSTITRGLQDPGASGGACRVPMPNFRAPVPAWAAKLSSGPTSDR
jgi:hypothetical protein